MIVMETNIPRSTARSECPRRHRRARIRLTLLPRRMVRNLAARLPRCRCRVYTRRTGALEGHAARDVSRFGAESSAWPDLSWAELGRTRKSVGSPSSRGLQVLSWPELSPDLSDSPLRDGDTVSPAKICTYTTTQYY